MITQRNSLWVQGSVLFPEPKELGFSLAWSCVLRIWFAVPSSSFLILIPLSIFLKSPFCFHQTGSAPIVSGLETEAICTVGEHRLLATSTAFLSLSFVFFSFVLFLAPKKPEVLFLLHFARKTSELSKHAQARENQNLMSPVSDIWLISL